MVETLVSRLKAQMAEKDKRLAQLKEAIKTLEKKLVEAMQSHASRTIRSSDASPRARARPRRRRPRAEARGEAQEDAGRARQGEGTRGGCRG